MTHGARERSARRRPSWNQSEDRDTKPLLLANEAAASWAAGTSALQSIPHALWKIISTARRKRVELMREVVQGRCCSCATGFHGAVQPVSGATYASLKSEQTRNLPLCTSRISHRSVFTTKTSASCPETFSILGSTQRFSPVKRVFLGRRAAEAATQTAEVMFLFICLQNNPE